MIHMHSMFSSENNTSTSGPSSNATLSQSTLSNSRLDSFHGALSDAVSSTLEKFGIHPNDVKISITRASAAATPPSTSRTETSERTAPPTPGTAASSSGSGSTTSSGNAEQRVRSVSTGRFQQSLPIGSHPDQY